MITQALRVIDKQGIHARPASIIVTHANQFSSKHEFEFGGKTVNLKSIMQILSLGIQFNDEIIIQIEGDDEDLAFEALKDIIKTTSLFEMAV